MKKFFSSLFMKYMIIFVSILLVTNVIATSMAFFVFGFDKVPSIIFTGTEIDPPLAFAIRIGLMSISIGTIFIFIATKIVLKPIAKLSEAAKKVAIGDFSVQIPTEGTSKDEITSLMNNFNLMIRELSKNEYLHKDFVSNVSHEFKTPITAIQGYAEMLSAPSLSDVKRVEYAKIIERQSLRLAKLSSDLLRLSELENDNITLKSEVFSLDEQIRDSILLLQTEWEQKNIQIDVELQQVKFQGDKALLYQVWVNIFSNAVRYTNQNGKIKVTLWMQNGEIITSIKDNGIGMTKEQNQRIFERFYRGDKSRTSEGNGLGMSIVKRIIQLHDGKIDVLSEQSIGTEIKITL